MLRVLLAKDLRRVRRNPLPWCINLIVPLCITALIGLVFGGRSDSGALGRIRFAVVDEDDSPLTKFMRGAANQGEGGKYLEPVFLDREAALRQINDNKLAAVLIIPTNFTRYYLTGSERVSLELIKNPAQSIHPAVLEELLGVVVAGLNAIARNFQSEFPEWQAVFEGKGDYRKVAQLIERAGDKLKAAKEFVNPPLVIYEKEIRESKSKDGASKSGPPFNLFAYLLAGMSAMFLLFLASTGMTDLHREVRFRTFERYHTMRQPLLPFVASKVIFTVVLLLLSSAVMLGGGALIFRIHWQHPLALAALVLGYAGFAAGLMAVLTALVADERLVNTLNTILGMALGLAGGCAFPPQNLPAFLREHVSPLLPTWWFAETVRNLEFGNSPPWVLVTLKFAGVSVALIALAAWLFRRRFKSGLRA
jgi:ABC-type multidrug transport system permease subunit